eukprot:750370-Hanusia_phi.AAC.2
MWEAAAAAAAALPALLPCTPLAHDRPPRKVPSDLPLQIGYKEYVTTKVTGGTNRHRAEMARKAALVLGGWSDGPLTAVMHACRSSCDFDQLTMHTPPVGLLCWFNPFLAVIVAFVVLVSYCFSLIKSQKLNAAAETFSYLALCVGFLIMMRILIALFVRYSIKRCIAAASAHVKEKRYDVVVGFSWGGGIGCWLLSEKIWNGPTMLLAPTVQVMAKFAWIPLPVFSGSPTQVHIFHANGDPFCPEYQLTHLRSSGSSIHVCDDSHVFQSRESEREIVSTFRQILTEVQ